VVVSAVELDSPNQADRGMFDIVSVFIESHTPNVQAVPMPQSHRPSLYRTSSVSSDAAMPDIVQTKIQNGYDAQQIT
jgi:hypothetical protein